MLQSYIFGLLLGLGAAIPIGAINLEIIRRNLNIGTRAGLFLGFGACLADLTYLVLLSLGALQLLSHPLLLKCAGVIGALILAWFGWQALTMKPRTNMTEKQVKQKRSSALKHLYQGYLLTLINAYTIIFWSSVSVTIAAHTKTHHAVLYAGIGVLSGTLSWVFSLNLFLQATRHRISPAITHRINVIGGLILLLFAVTGIWHVMSG